MDIRYTLGQNVKSLRNAAGLSQEALAVLVDVDQGYISRLEAGEKNPTILTIWHISQALGTTCEALLRENHKG